MFCESLETMTYVRFTSILDKFYHKNFSVGIAADSLAFVSDILGWTWDFLDHI